MKTFFPERTMPISSDVEVELDFIAVYILLYLL